MHILLIEDEPRIADFIERGLTEEGHRVTHARDLREARTLLASHQPSLLLVDRGLPDGDGLDLLRSLRTEGDTTPAICLTARDTVRDRVDGLYGGADDYLVKPFAFDELLARIAAIGRRVASTASNTLVAGPVRVDTDALRAWCGDRELDLTALEFRLLRHLIEQTGRICTRTRLLEAVWEMHHDPGTNVVDVYVSYLRHKLTEAGAPPMIHTVRGRGYLLEIRPGEP